LHRKQPFDLIECSDYRGWLRYGGPPQVPVVVRIRGSSLFFDTELKRPGDTFEHELERACLSRADYLGAVSHHAARRTLAIANLADRQCTVIYNAVDTDCFRPADEPVEEGLVLFVNKVSPRKGIEQLIDAMNLVFPTHSQARLVVIGGDSRLGGGGQSYAAQLKERVRPDFRDRVIFAGRQDRHTGVIQYLRRAQVCCYPSHLETFGIAAIEAMAMAKPTIVSGTGPGPELVEDGISGLLCDPFSPQDIAAKIALLLDNRTLAAQLGQGGRARVLAMFNQKDWIPRNLAFFRQCVKESGT
jgi:glycosyltransferase involved in cell wall biosynthesis